MTASQTSLLALRVEIGPPMRNLPRYRRGPARMGHTTEGGPTHLMYTKPPVLTYGPIPSSAHLSFWACSFSTFVWFCISSTEVTHLWVHLELTKLYPRNTVCNLGIGLWTALERVTHASLSLSHCSHAAQGALGDQGRADPSQQPVRHPAQLAAPLGHCQERGRPPARGSTDCIARRTYQPVASSSTMFFG